MSVLDAVDMLVVPVLTEETYRSEKNALFNMGLLLQHEMSMSPHEQITFSIPYDCDELGKLESVLLIKYSLNAA